ncbi:cation:H+ antiporter [Altererythrobacter atlanticus]|uniref:Inner membrane protein YrbG n=1 Tax=Croceibacterium atlanticum TaxID=1267766 RepID=A0A0F7KUI6_9SPHN|nr:calcium/sodium antiporter [Croceibacterium atlanticum]AKH42440.1 Inner membrane protein YrbG [Croceibacterium atlanticum]MBB5731217.1 cation:H+ antiporter [Croceibacterium atlanticum]
MTLAIVFLIAGLVALVLGGEWLVRGAVGLAAKADINPLFIGLVIVGFGTSMPELVTSVEAAMAGSPAIAWGNIVGSNVANSLLILGCAALAGRMAVWSANPLRDPLVALGGSALVFALALSGMGHQAIGLALLALLIAYIFWCYRSESRTEAQMVHGEIPADSTGNSNSELPETPDGWVKPVGFTLIGLAVLIAGGNLLVSGAIDLARIAGLSETLIGLTIVAVGTSFPELVTSVVAARKGEAEVAFGNVVGSNIYNLLGIGGATMLLAPGAIPANLVPLDLGLVTLSAVAIVLLLIFYRGVRRLHAVMLLLAYFAYLAFLIANA